MPPVRSNQKEDSDSDRHEAKHHQQDLRGVGGLRTPELAAECFFSRELLVGHHAHSPNASMAF
jgi:hypothetical protein